MPSQNMDSNPLSNPASRRCGLVMPISETDGRSEKHWTEVRQIITETIEAIGFTVNLVSDADDVGIIQKRIIQNLYENSIVVCDVSGKNPNVMFELGMRLAFDKPTIIVKDDETSYSFDTSPIEHLEYPRDLRFFEIINFKKKLAQKVKATHEAAENDPRYTTFLKNFGTFSVVSLQTKEVSKEDYIIEQIQELRRTLWRIEARQNQTVKVTAGIPARFQKDKIAIREAVAIVVKELGDTGSFDLTDMEDEILRRVYQRLHHGVLTRRDGEIDDIIREAIPIILANKAN